LGTKFECSDVDLYVKNQDDLESVALMFSGKRGEEHNYKGNRCILIKNGNHPKMDVFTKMDNLVDDPGDEFLGHFDIVICGMYFDGTTWCIRNTEHLLGVSEVRKHVWGISEAVGHRVLYDRCLKYIDRGITLFMLTT
jgi:hypothetical protein